MIIVNFSHSIEEHLSHIERLAGKSLSQPVIEVKTHFTEGDDYGPQVKDLIDNHVPLTKHDWDTKDIYIRLPEYAPINGVLLAYLHGLRGHFPKVIRFGRRADNAFELKEIVDLEDIRMNGRKARFE